MTSGSISAPQARLPEVAVGNLPRPEEATLVRLDGWEGPLGLLLALVETRRMDVLTVPLGGLAEAYLDALAGLEAGRLPHLSTFVAVASQLILIKSRALLPQRPETVVAPDEEPDPEPALRARLLAYRACRDAAAALAARAASGQALVRREPSAAIAAGEAGSIGAPRPRLDPALLTAALARLAAIAPPAVPPPEVIPPAVTLAERADLIRAALAGAGRVVLQVLLAGVRERVVVTVTFLAMLELVKRREATVEQERPWGPIIIIVAGSGAAGDGDGASEREVDQ
jgi:segregation and condensation protein A